MNEIMDEQIRCYNIIKRGVSQSEITRTEICDTSLEDIALWNQSPVGLCNEIYFLGRDELVGTIDFSMSNLATKSIRSSMSKSETKNLVALM
jgi:hypothetical protein